MLNQQIDYGQLVEKALAAGGARRARSGRRAGHAGPHHLYITFRTDHPGVVIDDTLHARYPNEMTIVLQHEFWGLEVDDERFAVTLSFNDVSHRLDIPFDGGEGVRRSERRVRAAVHARERAAAAAAAEPDAGRRAAGAAAQSPMPPAPPAAPRSCTLDRFRKK